MPANQDKYEKKIRDEIIAKLNEIKRISASIDAAAKAGQPLPIAAKEFLKKISIAMGKCQSVIDEHPQGDRFSDVTLRTVSRALREMRHSIDSLILYAVMEKTRAQK
jgi:predicted translin family RNA/ssDNA-binding protein